MNNEQNDATVDRVKKRRIELATKIYRGQVNLFIMGILTIVNIALYLTGMPIEIPFYLAIPYYFSILGAGLIGNGSQFGMMVTYFALSVAFIVLVAWLFWNFSKKKIATVMSQIITAIDLVALVVLIVILIISEGVTSIGVILMAINIFFHIWVMVYIGKAHKAVKGLDVLPTSEDEGDDSDPYAGLGYNSDEEDEENQEDEE